MRPAHRAFVAPLVCAISTAAALFACPAPARAQSEEALKAYFEGKHVTLKIDMPGTSDGVDVKADAGRAIDYQEYGNRLKSYGTAIRTGDQAVITLVKLKKDLIEFHLGGGGFGTFGDDTSTFVDIPLVEKSAREKDLEKLVRDEKESRKRRELQDELDRLRDQRERDNRRIEAERVRAEEAKKAHIAAERLQGGSRFNIRYANVVPSGIRPEEVMAALGEYVDFSPLAAAPPPAADIALKKGMSRADVERALGQPLQAADRTEGSVKATTLVFARGDERITVELVEGVLVRYTIASR